MKNKKRFLVGLEREALRLTKDGKIDTTPHPPSLGHKLYNPYITTDFSESQLELITKPFDSNKEALSSLKEIISFIYFKEPNIYLHNASMPPKGTAPIAKFGKDGKDKEDYRKYLQKKYGTPMQLISGVHYNFSIEGLLDHDYLHIIRNTIRYGFLFPALFGEASTTLPLATSIRGSSKGYFPKFQQSLPIDFNSKEGYLSSIANSPTLFSSVEYYLFIRPKFKDEKISHVELRSIDIDPSSACGIALETMDFARDFLFKMLEIPSPPLSKEELFSCLARHDKICLEGKFEDCQLLINKTLHDLDLLRPLSFTKQQIIPKSYPYLERAVLESIYSSLEISTQLLIEDAEKHNIDVTIIDRDTNTIKLSQDEHSTIISQATFTEKDSFISYQMQKDKVLTKKLLKIAGLSTPHGIHLTNKNEDLSSFLEKKVCIKPVTSNYGDGISILKTKELKKLQEAVDLAFMHSPSVLIEDFCEGEEYRFFVVNGSFAFVCKRMPPAVIGDGTSTLKELVDRENSKRPDEFPIKIKDSADRVVEKGKRYLVRENSNVSTGGTAIDQTEEIHESYKEIAKRAALEMKSFLCGVDILLKDPYAPATSDNYTILETNYNPALYLHRHPFFGARDVTTLIFRELGFNC